jgi:hypothetical protein
MTVQHTDWHGTYLLQGHDAQGPWALVGEGDTRQAQQSLRRRGAQTVTFLTAGQSDTEARTTATAARVALRAAGHRLVNRPAGSLTPAAALGASLNPAGVPRRRLTLADIGPAIVVSTELLYGWRPGNIRQSTFQAWGISPEAVAKLRRLLRAGTPARLLAVAPGVDIVVDVARITAARAFPNGRRYFGLANDPEATLLAGHYSPVQCQQGVRYLTATAVGKDAFLSLP